LVRIRTSAQRCHVLSLTKLDGGPHDFWAVTATRWLGGMMAKSYLFRSFAAIVWVLVVILVKQ
jgi:hypothetical protein